MAIRATWQSYLLEFVKPATTSRGSLENKKTYFIELQENEAKGLGECCVFRGLSCDDHPDFEQHLDAIVNAVNAGYPIADLLEDLYNYPSIRFGLESAYLQLSNKGLYYPSDFTAGKEGILINGLVWMADVQTMQRELERKIEDGFRVIKMKVGAIHWDDELNLLQQLRKRYDANTLEIRVDANGAFSQQDVKRKLDQLAACGIHSIEQPVARGQVELMRDLCEMSLLPIALDEELIGVNTQQEKRRLLQDICPHYIILKPSLLGGFKASQEWIEEAEALNIGWWVTSALESNIGLEAIAQWAYTLKNPMPQGLGTGMLFKNNMSSPLKLIGERLWYMEQ